MNAEADGVMTACEPAVQTRAPAKTQSRTAGLQPMRTDWPTAVLRRISQEDAVVRVLVAGVRGSAPREPGACMLVTHDCVEGTIGGGNLEWQAIEAARILLTTRSAFPAVRTRRVILGRELAQCCGGTVELWMERFTRADAPLLRRAAAAANGGVPVSMEVTLTAKGVVRAMRLLGRDRTAMGGKRVTLVSSDESHTLIERIDVVRTPVWLYGAGHVGQALVRTLSELPFHVTWVDSRAELFPAMLPANVDALPSHAPVHAAQGAPRGAHHIVMTHDHALDYDLCKALLTRGELAWLGLIGSESKGARFRSRLRREGVAPEQIARLICPIGLTHISSKLPAAIAIGIAAQLLCADASADPAVDAQDASGTERAQAGRGAQPRALDGCGAEDCASCQRTPR